MENLTNSADRCHAAETAEKRDLGHGEARREANLNSAQLVFGQPIPTSLVNKKANPLLRMFGKGPEGATCKTCTHLRRKHFSKVYIKCDLRPNTNGPATDHKAGWPACGKYQFATTETKRPVTSPGLDQSAASPQGRGRDGNKPLMQNRTANEEPSPTGSNPGDNFNSKINKPSSFNQ